MANLFQASRGSTATGGGGCGDQFKTLLEDKLTGFSAIEEILSAGEWHIAAGADYDWFGFYQYKGAVVPPNVPDKPK